MKDAYTLDRDEAGLDEQYQRLHRAYGTIFERCQLPVTAVAADVGMMGGSGAHEFMYLSPLGEDTVVLCSSCGYAQNRQVARAAKPVVAPEDPLPMERVATPGASTIADLCHLLGVPPERTAKAVFMATSEGRPVLAVVRGDMQLNEAKLANLVGAAELRPMTPDEIALTGCVAGYASPVGVGGRAVVVVDEIVAESPNLVAGANEEGWHVRNVNVGRDYQPDHVADLTTAEDGQGCADCGCPLRTERAVEVGNIFKLGTKYSIALGAAYLSEDGTERPVVMGSYGIGVGRLFACVAEEHRDERGLRWPAPIAPFAVHICALGDDGLEAAGHLAASLELAGLDVILDDRGERAGVQFADAELIGCPVQLTVSKRSLASGGVEAKLRNGMSGPGDVLSQQDVVDWARANLDLLASAPWQV